MERIGSIATGFLKLLFVLIRNQLWLKPRAWHARHDVRDFLTQSGWPAREVLLSLGLAEPDGLCLSIIFATDEELAAFRHSDQAEAVDASYRASLTRMRYPAQFIPLVYLTLHSHQEIIRQGGYRLYFQ